jgi:hypothetical protein
VPRTEPSYSPTPSSVESTARPAMTVSPATQPTTVRQPVFFRIFRR